MDWRYTAWIVVRNRLLGNISGTSRVEKEPPMATNDGTKTWWRVHL
jgi:hypothetical protein